MMILTCSSPLIAAKVTIAWITVCFNDVFVRHRHRRKFWPLLNRFSAHSGRLNLRLFIWHLVSHRVALLLACSTALVSTLYCLLCNRLLTFQVFQVLLTTGPWVDDFEQASGQQINRGKSALIPARQFSDDERASCLAVWNSDIRISSRERVHGVFIGIHVSIHDQYYNAVHKFDMAHSVFGRVRTSLSLAMRVLVVNIFMFTLFSYPNRQFFMPRVLLQEIERSLTPITWTKLGMFSAVGALYCTQLFLQDLRLSNVASVLSTHEAWSDSRRGTISALGRW